MSLQRIDPDGFLLLNDAAKAYLAQMEEASLQNIQRNEMNITHCAKLDRTLADLEDLLGEALDYEREAFDGTAVDLDVSGADLVDWFTQWREKVKTARMVHRLFF